MMAEREGNQASEAGAPDRQRSIETRDETGRAEGQTTGGGVSRRQGAQVYGSREAGMNPFAAMRRWSEDMDRLIQDFGFGRLGFEGGLSPFRELGGVAGRRGRHDIGDWSPQVEAFQRGDNFVVRADLPGMKKGDVKVEVENNLLTISGERNDEREENREGFYRSERSYGQFYRAIPLPEGVNAEQCEATFKDGVLEISLKVPKQREKSKQIPIR
jgi:HSP20 family protein